MSSPSRRHTSDFENQMYNLEAQAKTTLPHTPGYSTGTHPEIKSPHPPRTDYLDGLRGLAALFVFFHHITPDFTHGVHEYGFGQDGVHWHITSFPFIRLIWSGGNAAVPIFFILSGYALCIGPLKRLKQSKDSKFTGGGAEVRRGLLGAAVRRPIRLYAPVLAVLVIQALLLQVPGLVVIDPGLPPFPQANLLDELDFLVGKMAFFSPFHEHEATEPGFPYNKVVWTLPIELIGSLMVYGILAVFSMGITTGTDLKVTAAMYSAMILGGAVVLQISCHWSMVCFVWGMGLAFMDTWPIGTYLRNRVQEFCWRRKPVFKTMRLPLSVSEYLPMLPESLRPRLERSTTFAYICFFLGWYLLSQPGFPDHRWYSTNTPGWRSLSKMTPQVYDDARFVRYWTTIGSLLMVYAVLRIRWLQTLFQLRVLKFLGYISFMLYLTHLPWTHIFADRLKAFVGGYVNPGLAGGIWDHGFEITDTGPPGLSLRFLVSMSVVLPTTLLVAWIGTVAIDQPSVRLGKWFTRQIGIDRPEKERN